MKAKNHSKFLLRSNCNKKIIILKNAELQPFLMSKTTPGSLGQVRYSARRLPEKVLGAEPIRAFEADRAIRATRLGSAFGRASHWFFFSARPSVGQPKKFCPNAQPWHYKATRHEFQGFIWIHTCRHREKFIYLVGKIILSYLFLIK